MDIRKGGEYPETERAWSTLQTEGEKQFRMNRQVWIVLVTMLIALALPLAGVILTLQSLTKREPRRIRTGRFRGAAKHAGRNRR